MMQIANVTVSALSIILTSSLLTSHDAHAQSDTQQVYVVTIKDCGIYSSKAVRQVMESRGLRCGFKGPRWSMQRESHFSWCKGVTAQVRTRESDARAELLIQCKNKSEVAP